MGIRRRKFELVVSMAIGESVERRGVRLACETSLMAWTVYLLHFDRPSAGRKQHYVGFSRDLPQRLRHHREGSGSAITRRAFDRGIGFVLAGTWCWLAEAGAPDQGARAGQLLSIVPAPLGSVGQSFPIPLGNWSGLRQVGERGYAGAGIQGWPSVSMTRASKNVMSCLAAVDR